MRMKAAVCYGVRQPLIVEEVELDPPKAHEVLVQMTASGVCHSDYSMWTGHLPREMPIVLGHEGAGVVKEVGPEVTNVKPGDHVVLTYLPSCGRCKWCRLNREPLCDNLAGFVGRRVILGVRPEDMEDASLAGDVPEQRRLSAAVDLREEMGSEAYVYFTLDAPAVLTEDTKELAADVGIETLEGLEESAAQRRTTFVARLSSRSRAREGGQITVAVDTRALHFFDPETGESIYGSDHR